MGAEDAMSIKFSLLAVIGLVAVLTTTSITPSTAFGERSSGHSFGFGVKR